MQEKQEISKLYYLVRDELDKEILNSIKYKEISNRRDFKYDLLKNSISCNEHDLLEEYKSIINETVDFEKEKAFIKGFSLANKLIINSLENNS